MNWGINPPQYGAPLAVRRQLYKTGQGATQSVSEALLYANTDHVSHALMAIGATAPAASAVDVVLEMPRAGGSFAAMFPLPVFGAFSLTPPDGTVAGGNRRGAGAVDLQMVRTGATQVASGPRSLIAGGQGNTASGDRSMAIGSNNTSSGLRSGTFGTSCQADQQDAYSIGTSSVSRGIVGSLQWANGLRAAAGDRQMRTLVLSAVTTNATPTVLTTTAGAESTVVTWVIPANFAGAFDYRVVVKATATGGGVTLNDAACWIVRGLVKRDTTAASVALIGTPTVTQDFASASLATAVLAVSVNTTNGSLILTGTGFAGASLAWVAAPPSCIEVG